MEISAILAVLATLAIFGLPLIIGLCSFLIDTSDTERDLSRMRPSVLRPDLSVSTALPSRPRPPSTGIFISYRREDEPFLARSLYERLVARFGNENVFMDVYAIKLGANVTNAINKSLSECYVLLAIIGDRWTSVSDAKGDLRLRNPDDYVRREIEMALNRGILVIPVLAIRSMPAAAELPDSLAPLVGLNWIAVSHSTFDSDVSSLINRLEQNR